MAGKQGFRPSVYPLEEKRCVHCRKRFTTRDPQKRFCKPACRVANWARFNKDKVKKIQKTHRVKQKKEFDALVQEIIDSNGVQEN